MITCFKTYASRFRNCSGLLSKIGYVNQNPARFTRMEIFFMPTVIIYHMPEPCD